MKQFTIQEVERFSGVKAHTLRVWERRYGLLQPSRTAGNCRLYSVAELKKLLNTVLLMKQGRRISTVSELDHTSVDAHIEKLTALEDQWQKAIYDLTICMYSNEPAGVERLLDRLSRTWTSAILVEKIIYPFLLITSLLWVGNKLYEEHFVVTCMRQKLLVAIDNAQPTRTSSTTVLLFLPDNKQLDLGLLFSHYYLKSRGLQVIYLGTDVTLPNLQMALQLHQVDYLFTYLKPQSGFPLSQLSALMEQCSPETTLVVGEYSGCGNRASIRENAIRLDYWDALSAIKIKSAPAVQTA